jgi:beta-glucosidase
MTTDAFSPSSIALYQDSAQPVSARVEDLLQQMTLREKLGQLTQDFSGRKLADRNPEVDHLDSIRKGEIGAYIWAQYDAPMRNRLQRIAVEESRLGIPIMFGMDIIHGARTTFPSSIGLSCSFEPELFERMQTIAAREAAAEGIDWIFTPMCDLARDPRWGRVVETCGEDPYLSALCCAAQVRGLQGEDPSARDRVAACLKHFIGYSAAIGGRDYNETEVTAWTLRNGHLPAFKAGVEAGALTVMSSFNAIGGIPAVANRRALTGVLREEWGFDGFVVSDWNAVEESINWGYASDRADAARMAINAGNDMDMMTACYLDTLENELKEGRVSMEVLDQAVSRVLRVKYQIGLFDRPYVEEGNWSPLEIPQDARELAKECAVKSTVLLKNEDLLPLSEQVKTVALLGPFGDDGVEMLGCWSERGRPKDVVTLADALQDAWDGDVELKVCQGCGGNTKPRTKTLQDGTTILDEDALQDDRTLDLETAIEYAKQSDVVIMAVGEVKGWTGEDASRVELSLSGQQQQLFDAVAETGTPIITLLFSGRPLAVSAVYERSSAVLCAWQPGVEAGTALSEILTGKSAPEGRLTMSVPYAVGQVPIYYNRPKTGRPNSRSYRDLETPDPRYHFGFGLTYTDFEYGAVTLEQSDTGVMEACAEITNAGDRPGTETVQLYIRQLSCHSGGRSEQELRGFLKISLNPGEKQTVKFLLSDAVLGFTTLDGQWQVDAGDYHIWIAPHAHSGKPASYTHNVNVRI